MECKGLKLTDTQSKIWKQCTVASCLHCIMLEHRVSLTLPSAIFNLGARGSIVGWGTMLQARRLRVQVPIRWIFFNLPNPSSCTVTLESTQPLNRNEYQESSWGAKNGWCVKLTTLLASVSQLSRENVGASTSHDPMGLHGLLQG
jgi:hypothetical protein